MVGLRSHGLRPGRVSWLLAATALAGVLSFAVPASMALAQSGAGFGVRTSDNAEMLLESDELIYDNDQNTVTARGSVRIDYDGNKIVAEEVVYDRTTGRLIARGDVELIDPDGTITSAQEVDVTDDFSDGFANALRVETPEKTYFGAESASRREDNITTFNNGVYTACEPCEETPERAPIWRVKSQKIVWNAKEKTIRFKNPRFELFGLPIAYLPYFATADHTVKRKSGFLFPGFKSSSDLGVGVTIPYYLALDPTYDLTLWGTYYTKQGFLGQAEWRQRFDNGEYSVKIAGIKQQSPEEFLAGRVGRGYANDPTEFRGMVGTKGRFEINPRWTFGWDVLYQTDKSFAFTYDIGGYEQYRRPSEVYLTGLNDRNFFDLRAMRFHVQEAILDRNAAGDLQPRARDPRQPWVLPSLDYTKTLDEPVAGGELRFDLNARSLHRDTLDAPPNAPGGFGRTTRLPGIDGNSSRMTAEVEWKRQLVTETGLVITPILHLQGDATYASYSTDTVRAINGLVGTLNRSPAWRGDTVSADVRSAYYRYMATAGLDVKWPILFSTTSSSHILEPIGQIFVRPDEPYAGTLGIPNEDAQSFVFDATTLFERDKFSGYDRIEGGTRANLGIRYSGSYANGWATNAIFGQSYHLGGVNSFASPDLVHAGAYSGLDTARSDYVALVGVTSPRGVSLATSARFDKDDWDPQRVEVRTGYNTRPFSVVARYAFIDAQPLYGFDERKRHEVMLGGSLRFQENWRAFASGTYDLESATLLSDTYGISYDDECFTLMLALTQTRSTTTDEVSRSFRFNIAFRTLGEFGSASSAFQ